MRFPESYGYVERINCCDLIVNPSNCGDFEHIILESQACGIPLAHTDDQGIMVEAMGSAGIRLKTSDISRGRIGQKIYFVNPKSIADTILAVQRDHQFSQKLRHLGLERAQQYPWSALQNAMVNLVENLASTNRKDIVG
jgi:glycosyltransferase involved in cell wall biosynthesis